MKKIMFNDKFGLTRAVLDGRKTMTRRVIICPREFRGEWVAGFYVCKNSKGEVTEVCMYDADERMIDGGQILPKYKIGEVVAIAQSYSDCGNMPDLEFDQDGYPIMPERSGFFNKMFVKADLMPHHIKITGIKVERLQDISDEDCLKEGIIHACTTNDGIKIYHTPHTKRGYLSTDVAQRAFEFLINKVCGKGVFQFNPYVFVYEFALID